MIRELIYQKDITITNIYSPNDSTPKYMKQKLVEFKNEIDISTIIVQYFNTLFSIMDRITRQKANI